MSFTVTEKPSKMSTTQFTQEQLKRMEENKRKALEKIAQKGSNINATGQNLSVSSSAPPTSVSKSIFINSNSKVTTLSSISQNIPGSTATTTTSNVTKPASNSINKVATLNSAMSTTLAATSAATAKPAINQPQGGYNGKCQLLPDDPENRFEIIVGYNKGLVDLFKSIQSKKYDPDTKRWNFSLKSYDEIMFRIKDELNNSIKLEPLDRSNKKTFMLKFVLINNREFEAQCDYNQELNEVFKTMKTRKYNTETKRWSFSLGEYEELINAIRTKCGSSVTIVQFPKLVKEIFKEKISNKMEEKQPIIDLEHLR
jgi:hypothetical protein